MKLETPSKLLKYQCMLLKANPKLYMKSYVKLLDYQKTIPEPMLTMLM
jgi:hypothetical protein